MGGVVVHDEVNVQIGRHLFLQLIEEPDELLGAVPGKTAADHFPVQNIERREQSSRTVALIVVRLPFRQTRS